MKISVLRGCVAAMQSFLIVSLPLACSEPLHMYLQWHSWPGKESPVFRSQLYLGRSAEHQHRYDNSDSKNDSPEKCL